MSEVKKLCPKGSKVCPNCKNFVKGPRTKVCTHKGCSHVFVKGEPVKVKAKAVEVTAEPVVQQIPDPYTFQEIIGRKGGTVMIRKAAGILVQPNNTNKAVRYAANIEPPPVVNFANVVNYA